MTPLPGPVLARRPAWVAGGVLFLVYVATLAPSVTLWDSGEFLAAIHALGVPHPPGTPLFVVAAHAWGTLLGGLAGFAQAVNLASAAATVLACVLLSGFVRGAGGALGQGLAILCAGFAASTWLSATETEVYAWALLLMALMLRVADAAGQGWSGRHARLLCFLLGLAVPLHLSALVAGPAAVWLAATDASGRMSWRATLEPGAAWLLAAGVGTVSLFPIVAALVVYATSRVLGAGREEHRGRPGPLLLTLIGASFLVVMWVVARHDPFVNQGDPSSWDALMQVVGRRQYDVPGLWPRRAPFWLQLGNLVQYADWQWGLAWSDAVGPSWRRTPLTLACLATGVAGALHHRRVDPRGFAGLGWFFLCATVGVVTVLNLRAGPSYGWGILPADALREARERDYFFTPAFTVWGLWMGAGVGSLLRHLPRRWPLLAGAACAAVLATANWNAVDRRRGPAAPLASALGESLLVGAPPRAVLLLAGDNDAYATWYQQEVMGIRRDVATVVVPLLPATWYREELRRRHHLLPDAMVDRWAGAGATLASIAESAREVARPLAASVALPADQRAGVAEGWRLHGMVYVAGGNGLSIEPGVTERVAGYLAPVAGSRVDVAGDPAAAYIARLLRCPAAAVARQAGRDSGDAALLESTCNYR